MGEAIRRGGAVLAAFAAAALAATGSSATAHADTASYIAKLHDAGINPPRGDIELKEWGWEICALTDSGTDPDKVRQQAVYNSGSKPQYGMSDEQVDTVVHLALTELCTDRA